MIISLSFFSCRSQESGRSVFVQQYNSKQDLLNNGYNYIEHPGIPRTEKIVEKDWLQKMSKDTIIWYHFRGDVLLRKEIFFDKQLIDSAQLFNYLTQLGFKQDSTTIQLGQIKYSVQKDKSRLWFIETFRSINDDVKTDSTHHSF